MEHHSAAASPACRLSKLALIERFALRYDEILEYGLLLQGRSMVSEGFKEALSRISLSVARIVGLVLECVTKGSDHGWSISIKRDA